MKKDEDIQANIKELKDMALEVDLPLEKLLPMLTLRELVLINRQLKAVHEHLDMIESREALKHE